MPTLELAQHVLDYLLCRPPVAAVYLAAAVRLPSCFALMNGAFSDDTIQVVLSRKEEATKLEEEDEDGMVYSVLSALPDIFDDVHETAGENGDCRPEDQVKDESLDNDWSHRVGN